MMASRVCRTRRNCSTARCFPSSDKRFQVRLYGFGRDAVRVDHARTLTANDNATRIGDSLKHIAAEAGTMPLGAIVVMSDGGDNTGGVDRDTIAQLRQLHIPVHTVVSARTISRKISRSSTSRPPHARSRSRG